MCTALVLSNAKLQDKYGEDTSFNRVRGQHNVVCLSNFAKHIINEMWYENRRVDPNNGMRLID